MTRRGSTRKKRTFSELDDSQKSIESFFLREKDRKNINESQHKLRSGESPGKISPRKKQTLLVPFDKTSYPNSFKITKMDCKKSELSLSHKRSKYRNYDNVMSSANDIIDVTRTETLGDISSCEERDLELVAIECCEKAESMAMSQENLKHRDDHINSNPNHDTNFISQVSNSAELDETEHDAEIIECCEKAELSFSQEKLKQKNTKSSKNSSCHSPNMFGLFGISSSDEEELGLCFDEEMQNYQLKSYFDKLPDEILENIFCQLPLVDLLMNLSLVCKRWHRIISCEKFLLWKKRYYRYKQFFESREEIDKIIIQEQLHVPQVFPTNLCRFLTRFRVVREDHSNLLDMLRLHTKYHLIEKFILDDKQADCCWSVVGLLSLVSNSVYDIQEIIACQLKSSTCLLYDILECLHCLALIFFVLMEKQPDYFCSHHYRIYYALYLHENTSNCTQTSLQSAYSANKSGQQCILKYRESSDKTWLTHEQVRIMNHNTKYGDVLKIVAFAGTGKTTTLVEYTKLRPSWNFLNVAYNKSVQEQAVRKFPQNVESRTVHSLAYRAVGYKFRGKMASSLRVNNIMDSLGDKSSNFLHAKRIVDTLTNFICSYDELVSSEHVPYKDISSQESDGDRKKLEYFNSDEYKKIVVRDCKEIWERMSDPANRDVRITHDGYLKLYQLSKPALDDYDCILVDEAQDCTPAVADILLSQKVAKILVGDPHQQIYGFRGATNSMSQVEATHVYYLTQSFRFGSEIASVASSLLDILKGVRSKNIVGVSKPGSFHGEHVGQIAIICRTNFSLFNNAVLVCTRNNKTRISFAGGIQGYNLERILDIHILYSGAARDGIKDRFIQRFRSFVELKNYARKAPDVELAGKIKIVETHHINIPNYVARIKNQYCKDIDQAEIVFSTAHKSKGLEFDTVRIGEDFLQDLPIDELSGASTDEKNLLYVAVTRAKFRLQCSTLLCNILSLRTDLLVSCEVLQNVPDIESETYCAECKELCDFTGSFVIMRRAQVFVGSSQKIDGGILCCNCVLKRVPFMGNLLIRRQEN
ncbi:F-box DNA helicase 1-like [Dendronephthya gigantea]|uniref:F-box DNA helicase 1-like n=1 Tax=Dendronephthya gigantea TaxID=151771 RepID=UPI00106CB120|nr:F-box DNA helicase 1-like [Dendronephthya gigantea]